MKGYPKWFSVIFISSIVFLLSLTGLLLAPTTLSLRFSLPIMWRLVGEQHGYIAAIHVVVGLISFALVGALWSLHMRQEWKRKQKRMSGVFLNLLMVILGLTGIFIYYVTNEYWLLLTSTSHLVAGIVLVLIYLLHAIFLKTQK